MQASKLTRHAGPAQAWVATFVLLVAADALFGRWVFLPIFVVGFYGGMLAVALLTYPLLERWRGWMRPRGVRAWYLTVVSLWTGVAFTLTLLSPRWLDWGWDGKVPLQVAGALVLTLSVGFGAWAMGATLTFVTAAWFPDSFPSAHPWILPKSIERVKARAQWI